MSLLKQSRHFGNIFPKPQSVAVLVIVVFALADLLTPGRAEHVMKVYRGRSAGGGSVTELVLITSDNDYEVLNITVSFTNGSTIYATRTFSMDDTITLCAENVGSYGWTSEATCFSMNSQTGLATYYTKHLFYDWNHQKGASTSAGKDSTENTTDGIHFKVVEKEVAPWAYGSGTYQYHFNGTTLVWNSSYAIKLDSEQLRIQNGIKDAFTKSWSAVSFLSSGVLEHGPRGLYVTDGKGGSANLTDTAGVPLDTTSAPSKGSFTKIAIDNCSVILLLWMTAVVSSLVV